MATPDELKAELDKAIEEIVNSSHPKKLILAGPGAGKTTLFKKLLEKNDDGEKNQLVLTFINNLKNELHEKLSHSFISSGNNRSFERFSIAIRFYRYFYPGLEKRLNR